MPQGRRVELIVSIAWPSTGCYARACVAWVTPRAFAIRPRSGGLDRKGSLHRGETYPPSHPTRALHIASPASSPLAVSAAT
jgi:hypothetical protein